MTYNSNPYINQIKEQGRDPVNQPAKVGEFPKTIYGRTYDTKEEYLSAIHDFLNGNWMTSSNLSKIKPKLRTQGNVTGNFGRPKSRAGSQLSDIGNSKKDVINITTRKEYINRMITAYHNTDDDKLKSFCYHELHRLHAI